ncbi:MAG: type II toxin-antitoxin system CcdA family antitoxin [Solirubrobacteraceae bacterium]
MARVNITVSDDLLERSRAAGLNVSRVSSDALSEELDRRERIGALDRYLRALDVELGPVPTDEQAAAREWADRALGEPPQQMPVRANRTA